MLSNEEIEKKFKAIDGVYYAKVEGDGYHYQLTIVTDIFLQQSKVARQQWVYAQIKDLIISGKLHALQMKTWTEEEWGKQQNG